MKSCCGLYLLLCFTIALIQSEFTEETCHHTITSKSGICKRIDRCPYALQNLQQSVSPQQCGFEGITPIVCCPQDIRITTTTNAPVSAVKKVGDKATEKCSDYAKYVYVEREPIHSPYQKINVSQCGIPLTLHIRGPKAKEMEFPHMAAIGYDSGSSRIYLCGGSLISERFILTAAHCRWSREYGTPKVARLGVVDISGKDIDAPTPQDYDIMEIIPHPLYKNSHIYNDIALLKLTKPVAFNGHVRPICLNIKRNIDEARAVVVGFDNTNSGDFYNNHLLRYTADLLKHEQCAIPTNKRRMPHGIVDDTQICASTRGSTKDNCRYDGGGPIFVYNEDHYCTYTLIGISSITKQYGSDLPGVYTRVSHYIEWIENIVWP